MHVGDRGTVLPSPCHDPPPTTCPHRRDNSIWPKCMYMRACKPNFLLLPVDLPVSTCKMRTYACILARYCDICGMETWRDTSSGDCAKEPSPSAAGSILSLSPSPTPAVPVTVYSLSKLSPQTTEEPSLCHPLPSTEMKDLLCIFM